MNLGWGLLSLKRRYRGGVSRVVELRAGELVFELSFTPTALRVQQHAATAPAVVVRGGVDVFRPVLWRRGAG